MTHDDLSLAGGAVRMTIAQAIGTYLANQFIEIAAVRTCLCGGGSGIFGHGNAPVLGDALYAAREVLPLYRRLNEQSMGFAAAASAKAQLRRRFMLDPAGCRREIGTPHAAQQARRARQRQGL